MKENKDLKAELVEDEQRVREGVMDEMKGWKKKNKVYVDQEIIEKELKEKMKMQKMKFGESTEK